LTSLIMWITIKKITE